jgi:plastocyanin
MPDLYKVNIKPDGNGNVVFDPSTLTVNAGDQISWTNFDSVAHLPGVVNDDGSFVGLVDNSVPGHGGVSNTFSPSAQYDSTQTIQQPYSFTYTCCDNTSIKGTINVEKTP